MTKPDSILVAEDDKAIRTGLVDSLESEGYQVVEAENGIKAMELLTNESFALLILDIMMPGKSGYDVCRELRRFDRSLPVLMLTAKGEELDKVLGLELGADDYMTKPFGLRELLARVHALLRRRNMASNVADVKQEPFDFADLIVDPKRLEAKGRNTSIPLSDREVRLLQTFSQHPDEVMNRNDLLNEVWGIDYYGTTRTLDQHIAQLRKKIEPDRDHPCYIQTVHGVGYRYRPASQA